ncbi:hypothetical protein FBZ93_12272 [Bradyrhizobium macuxiense]|uniref:DUF2285 domain-containing protein n=1 Tax=Bradyrhizobium macuxiense TaxID=1755647 RepID=A0A560KVL8_9BRAD|nr:DUF2285 domain-containing protein [Bradyrhizobium macuxiense]TWB87291.1 hypothetical protein FBZ93_12272 [Bradyrhizobium macuxiense]
MKKPVDPDVSDITPNEPVLTAYDEQHLVAYWRLLDAEGAVGDWKEVARTVLHIDPDRGSSCPRERGVGHLAGAKWVAHQGYRDLPTGGTTK